VKSIFVIKNAGKLITLHYI